MREFACAYVRKFAYTYVIMGVRAHAFVPLHAREYVREADSLFNTHHVTVLHKRAVLSCARVIWLLQGKKVKKCEYVGRSGIGHVAIYELQCIE